MKRWLIIAALAALVVVAVLSNWWVISHTWN